MKKMITPVFCILIFIVGTVFMPAPTVEGSGTGLLPGRKAPDCELEDLNGNTIKLSDYKGTKVIISFWASWCSACKEQISEFNRFYKETGNNLKLLAVHIYPTNDLPSFVEQKVHFPVFLDKTGEISRTYGVNAVPTTYFIDEKGRIIRKHLGVLSYEKLREYSGY